MREDLPSFYAVSLFDQYLGDTARELAGDVNLDGFEAAIPCRDAFWNRRCVMSLPRPEPDERSD
jgi:hypothetical protein